MEKRHSKKRELTRREFLGKALFPTVAFGFLSAVVGNVLPREKRREGDKPNISLKEASHYSKLAG